MANRETSIAYENLNRRIFPGVGEYGIPQIKPEAFEGNCEFVGFNYARGKCSNPEEKAVHFFLDDYQFDALWRNPDRYVDKLSKFRYILTPDFQHLHRFSESYPDIQPLPQTLDRCISARIWLPRDSNNLMEHAGFLRLVFRWGARGRNSCSIFCWLHERKEKERTVSFWLQCHD